MARTTAPFLSLGASGKFADTLVASSWKGISYMRKFVIPSNPNTAAQSAWRTLWANTVLMYQTIFTVAAQRTGWNVYALKSGNTQSGFNAFMQAAASLVQTNPDASMCQSATFGAAKKAVLTMKNLDDGGAGDEAGDFSFYAGTTSSNLTSKGTAAIAAGTITSPDLGDASAYVYIQITKDGVARSGIFYQLLG
jgi:hypothetical protein